MKKFIFLITVLIFLNSSIIFANSHISNNSRFIINKAEVFDKKTNLVWLRCSVGSTWKKNIGCTGLTKKMYLDEAKAYVLKIGQRWRIPTIDELLSINEETINHSKIFPDFNNIIEYTPYWSITHVENMPILFYFVDFFNKSVDAHSPGFAMSIRLVKNKNIND